VRVHSRELEKTVSNSEEQRIAKEEEYWTTPRLLRFGLVFLGICIAVLYVLATFTFNNVTG
jgi:hypothetical protein